MDDFNRDISMQTGVSPLIDSCHASFTNLSNDLIFVNDIADQNSPLNYSCPTSVVEYSALYLPSFAR